MGETINSFSQGRKHRSSCGIAGNWRASLCLAQNPTGTLLSGARGYSSTAIRHDTTTRLQVAFTFWGGHSTRRHCVWKDVSEHRGIPGLKIETWGTRLIDGDGLGSRYPTLATKTKTSRGWGTR